MADGPALPGRPRARGPGLGDAAAVAGAGAGRGVRRGGAAGPRARPHLRPCLPRRRLRVRPVTTDADDAGTHLDRGLAERGRAMGAAPAGPGRTGRVAATSRGSVRRRCRHGRWRQRSRHRSGAAARRGLAADEEPGPQEAEHARVVAGVHRVRHAVVAGPALRAGCLQPAVPRLHRVRRQHHVPDHARRLPAWRVQLGALHPVGLAGGQRPDPRLDHDPEQRRPAALRDDRADLATQPAPALPGDLTGARSPPGDDGAHRGCPGVGGRGTADLPRRRPRPIAQRAQVRRGDQAAAGPGPRLDRRGRCGSLA